jgi:hypothetical protein
MHGHTASHVLRENEREELGVINAWYGLVFGDEEKFSFKQGTHRCPEKIFGCGVSSQAATSLNQAKRSNYLSTR